MNKCGADTGLPVWSQGMTQAKLLLCLRTLVLQQTLLQHSLTCCNSSQSWHENLRVLECELHTVVVDEQSSINVEQTPVITAETEAPQATDRQFNVPRELQPVTLHPHIWSMHCVPKTVAQGRAWSATDRAHRADCNTLTL